MAKMKKPTVRRSGLKATGVMKQRNTLQGSHKKTKNKDRKAQASAPPIIPFQPTNRILLVGEGDFSFSYSLLSAHNSSSLVATSFDTENTATSKYPQASTHIFKLQEAGCPVLFGVDATKLGKPGASNGGGEQVRKGEFDRIVFNFPHVGGLTKDVNRQVRHNQELLVNFLKSALPLLAPQGSIIITVFEGEPYDLWNVRDLARHTGLQVDRSFKFQASAYPGYKHVRTLGNIDGGGGWKGEDRPARTYIFSFKDAQATPTRAKVTDESDDE